ncbi:MAG: hypothetical protein ABW182_15170 [Sphingomonas sp.]
MAYVLGSIAGACLLVYLLQLLWEYLLFMRIMDRPVAGKAASALAAWVTSMAIAFAAQFNPVWYCIAALIVGALVIWRGVRLERKMQAESEAEDELETTFR